MQGPPFQEGMKTPPLDKIRGKDEIKVFNDYQIYGTNVTDVHTIATNLPLPSVTIDTIHELILSLTNVMQARLAALHPTIDKRRRKAKTRRTVRAHRRQIYRSPLLFYGRCCLSSQRVSPPTGNTLETLQCVRVHRKALERACHPFKVLTLVCAKIFNLTKLCIGPYCGNWY